MGRHQDKVLEVLKLNRERISVSGKGSIDDLLHPEAALILLQGENVTQDIAYTSPKNQQFKTERAIVYGLHAVGSRPALLGRSVFDLHLLYKEIIPATLEENQHNRIQKVAALEQYLRTYHHLEHPQEKKTS